MPRSSGAAVAIERHARGGDVAAAHDADGAFAVDLAHRAADALAVEEALHGRQEGHELVVVPGLELTRIAELVIELVPRIAGPGRRQMLPVLLQRCGVVERQEIDRPKQDLAQVLDALFLFHSTFPRRRSWSRLTFVVRRAATHPMPGAQLLIPITIRVKAAA